MLNLFAKRVEQHPSCRVSLRHNWPGPHHHHQHGGSSLGNDSSDAGNSEPRQVEVEQPRGRQGSSTAAADAVCPTALREAQLCTDGCHKTVSTPMFVPAFTSLANCDSSPNNNVSLVEAVPTQDLSSMDIANALKGDGTCHHRHGTPNLIIHVGTHKRCTGPDWRRCSKGGAVASALQRHELQQKQQMVCTASGEECSKIKNNINTNGCNSKGLQVELEGVSTVPHMGGRHTPLKVVFSPDSTAQSSSLEALTSTGTWPNQTIGDLSVSTDATRKKIEESSPRVTSAKSSRTRSAGKSLLFKAVIERRHNSKLDGASRGVREDTTGTVTNPAHASTVTAATVAVADSRANALAHALAPQCNEAAATLMPKVEARPPVSLRVNAYCGNPQSRPSQSLEVFCQYERRRHCARCVPSLGQCDALSADAKPVVTGGLPSSPNDRHHHCFGNGMRQKGLDDSYHNDQEAFDALSISTTSSCVFGVGIAGFMWEGSQADDAEKTGKATAMYAVEATIYAVKEKAKRRNAVLLSEHVAHVRSVPHIDNAEVGKAWCDGTPDALAVRRTDRYVPAAGAAPGPLPAGPTQAVVRRPPAPHWDTQREMNEAVTKCAGIRCWLAEVKAAQNGGMDLRINTPV
ncbi:hypothetical protein DQ04_06821000 [Trypanosoma grayi]|uniref:hypothetical protein n=1 Tax=Trypanosoma grayi TaxID=71804 RepID=UPI0004F3F663|nr:hypothetical protein DQ04_06821000 [Trypanosoma grayi]KEG08604.1 hypothetical protein DQ04_06821000 [Trypanosoma grayi]